MSRGRVLLAEDHAPTLRLWRTLIEPEFEVVGTVSDGQSLVDAVERLSPDVIVSDIAMPKVTGLELIEQVRRRPGPRLPAIALSAYGRVEDRERALDAGFDLHLVKPADARTLVGAVARAAAASDPRPSPVSP